MPQPRAALAKGLVFVGAATMVGNGAAYLLSMISARVLSPAQFGALGALLGLLVIISTIGIATQAFTARRVAVATTGRAESFQRIVHGLGELATWIARRRLGGAVGDLGRRAGDTVARRHDGARSRRFLRARRVLHGDVLGFSVPQKVHILQALQREAQRYAHFRNQNWASRPFGALATQDMEPAFREWLADYYVSAEAIRLLSFRTLTALSHGKAPGPEGSAGKLLWATQTQELTNQAMDIQDHFGLIDDAEVAMLSGGFQHRFLWAPALRLGGGTDEIMKNIIAERVLGLPGDVRVDKNVPFREIPTGR